MGVWRGVGVWGNGGVDGRHHTFEVLQDAADGEDRRG